MTINLKGYVHDALGVAKQGVTAEAWIAGGVAASFTDTTDVNGMWNHDALDGTQDWLIKVIDGTKVKWIDGRSKIQVHEVSGVIIDNGFIDMQSHQIINITNLVGYAATGSLFIKSNMTGVAAAQRDIYIQTGNASNPQTLGNRMLFRSNAADGAVGIMSFESLMFSAATAMSIVNDSTAGAPASAQVYSSAPGVLDLASGAGNNVTAVKRLSISQSAGAGQATVTWSAVNHDLGSGTITTGGSAGVASFGPAAVASITVKNGIITAIS